LKSLRNDPILKARRRELRRGQTEAEKEFWRAVRNRRLKGQRFFRQYSIGPYILDFYCPQLRLAVELDGGQHAEDEHLEYDAVRSAYLKAEGVHVVRFWNHEVLTAKEAALRRLEKEMSYLRK